MVASVPQYGAGMQPSVQTWLAVAGGGAALGEQLLAAYAEPQRAYHDRTHLAEVLDAVDELGGGDVVRLAAWFHDAVYDPTRNDNEARSAAWAEAALVELGHDRRRVAEVARLVRLTRTHAPAAGDRDGAVLCDADLAILGAAPDRYARYAAGVRREYAHVDDAAFALGRGRVLRALLDRPALYTTPRAQARWEERARRNVEGELLLLSPEGAEGADGAGGADRAAGGGAGPTPAAAG